MGSSAKMYVVPVLLGIGVALAGRVVDIFLGRRRLPTYPHGEIIHFFLGFVAGVLGGLAVPSILAANYTAGVFLGLGTTQFHTVRGQERATLLNLEDESRVPRGKAYIEDLTQKFEAQNFLMFGLSLVTCLGAIRVGLLWGVAFGLASLALIHIIFRARRLGGIATVFVQPPDATADPAEAAVTILLHPNGPRAAAVLRNPGQQQALKHDLHAILGSRLGSDGGERDPEIRVASPDGTLQVRLWPVEKDLAFVRRAVSNVPVLESIAAPLRAEGGARPA